MDGAIMEMRKVSEWQTGWASKSLSAVRRACGMKESVQAYINDLFPGTKKWHTFPKSMIAMNLEAAGQKPGCNKNRGDGFFFPFGKVEGGN
jgi:hypothetical protein